MRLLWLLLPDSAIPLLIVGVLLEMFPWWVSPLLLVVFVMSVLRAASGLLLGERASGHMVGILAADVVRGIFKTLLLPFRLLARLAKPY
jgi:hypothetical protein